MPGEWMKMASGFRGGQMGVVTDSGLQQKKSLPYW